MASIAKQQKEIGYESVFIEGEKESMAYMKELFNDWQAKGITSVLHEKKGGYANNTASIYGLAHKAESEGVRILTGVKVTGFRKDSSGAVRTVITDKGDIACDQVIIGAGPWIKQIWDMYDGTIYVGGKIAGLGVDAVPAEMTDLEASWLERKLKMYGLAAPRGVKKLQKIAAGRQLWNYDNLEPAEKKLIL